MLKNISNLGSTLNKQEQQTINGGNTNCGVFTRPCRDGYGFDENCWCVPEPGN
ncbi:MULTISPECIES: hypothetical protein [unclassified Tenacibaculum]|uniref:hypothetical protein n=1 Tax=unclassified Tenacibaculum TaxID=2635139 RepID=UPI001F40283E|nr:MULTISPECIES: hypothetical protein [unclassified Tenacibaculum]MCF2874056.1 hypothetical protein [Tenacibaculum sp. Cn5-1]MCF2934637.1 hypothetical protein [Tenacibaculum sp. Cn5-34]MCG7510847.1 hypothetical protein [Tenacibaculum sp. Cn5-46]